MISIILPSRRPSIVSKVCVAASLLAASLLAGSSAFGQGYSDNFNSYLSNGSSLSGQGPWDTNDAASSANVGQSDYVGPVTGYTPTGSGDYWAYVGGGQRGTNLVPGAPTVYVYAPFSLSAAPSYSYAFNVDMSIASSTSSFTNRDSFAWTFLGASSGASIGPKIFSLNFTPDAGGYLAPNAGSTVATSSLLNINYTTYAANGSVVNQSLNLRGISYDSIYHLTITVNVTSAGAAGTASIVLTPSAGGGPAVTLATGVPLVNPGNVRDVAATWNLTNTTGTAAAGYANGGGNELLFNNYSVAVPEPSTWAMLGFGVLCAAGYARRRIRA